ncbi:hypothetical protein SKAU_G00219560 [Synaphobranchus kaupii]|uniref:Uncharacterized protein n=1 Tax=Synaphobranchus kaupii TaxID=118154 RepID=A0A9Q1FAG6_SYNKA|nr:hypothetical protein SKAU_G00219560 [Synaphobranchus kaupii]
MWKSRLIFLENPKRHMGIFLSPVSRSALHRLFWSADRLSSIRARSFAFPHIWFPTQKAAAEINSRSFRTALVPVGSSPPEVTGRGEAGVCQVLFGVNEAAGGEEERRVASSRPNRGVASGPEGPAQPDGPVCPYRAFVWPAAARLHLITSLTNEFDLFCALHEKKNVLDVEAPDRKRGDSEDLWVKSGLFPAAASCLCGHSPGSLIKTASVMISPSVSHQCTPFI